MKPRDREHVVCGGNAEEPSLPIGKRIAMCLNKQVGARLKGCGCQVKEGGRSGRQWGATGTSGAGA